MFIQVSCLNKDVWEITKSILDMHYEKLLHTSKLYLESVINRQNIESRDLFANLDILRYIQMIWK